jgi:hypothetical protein
VARGTTGAPRNTPGRDPGVRAGAGTGPALDSTASGGGRVTGPWPPARDRAYDLIRTMMTDGCLTGLGSAFAHHGRIFKTLHLPQVIHLEEYRRMIGPSSKSASPAVTWPAACSAQLRAPHPRVRARDGRPSRRARPRPDHDHVVHSLYIDAAVAHLKAGGLEVGPRIRVADRAIW